VKPVRFFVTKPGADGIRRDYLALTDGEWKRTYRLEEAEHGIGDTWAEELTLDEAKRAAEEFWGADVAARVISVAINDLA
jgi:hypothetical protein